ncbi:hypothetical protein [Salinibacter altiplanensis]|uniref:hypothetical protein n=1 Tax=Salinibacter altiplanensis TaxID=1803181 RepID=UPI000C9FED10|nr:hypothetical protein [Salinibacter altiplanensis]
MAKKQTSILFEEDLREWIKSEPGGMAETIRRALQMYRIFRDPIKKLGALDDDAMGDVDDILTKTYSEYRDEEKEVAHDFDGSAIGRYKQPHEYHALSQLALIALKARARNQGFLELQPKFAPEDYDPDTVEVITR